MKVCPNGCYIGESNSQEYFEFKNAKYCPHCGAELKEEAEHEA